MFSPICAFQLYFIILCIQFRVPVGDLSWEKTTGKGCLKRDRTVDQILGNRQAEGVTLGLEIFKLKKDGKIVEMEWGGRVDQNEAV